MLYSSVCIFLFRVLVVPAGTPSIPHSGVLRSHRALSCRSQQLLAAHFLLFVHAELVTSAYQLQQVVLHPLSRSHNRMEDDFQDVRGTIL